MKFLLLIFVLISFALHAEEVKEKIKDIKEEAGYTEDLREYSKGTIMVGYQLISSWVPSKKNVSYTHIFNKKWSLEGDYSWSSVDDPVIGVDLAGIKEKRFNLQVRQYMGNSFNVTYGAVYSALRAHVGEDLVGQDVSTSFSAQNIGITGGFGNRWQWANGVTFGVEWMRINVPIFDVKIDDAVVSNVIGQDDKDDIEKVIHAFNRFPTFVFLGLTIGYTF